MDTEKFLSRVWPTEGWYCIQGMKLDGSYPVITWHDNIPDACNEIARLTQNSFNAYYACASFERNTKREQVNVHACKAFWLDIDCGERKQYPTQEAGIEALVGFCNKYSMPVPTVVSSGYGIHVYWCLKSEVPRSEWKGVAEQLKVKCREAGLLADASVTSDEARILRPPGSKNFKNGTETEVEVYLEGPLVEFDVIKSALGVVDIFLNAPDYIRRELTPLQKSLQESRRNRFSTILDKTSRSIGCAQIEYLACNQAGADYNLWRAGLSIARNCVDGDIAIHAISSEHPEYTHERTVIKAEDLIDKPYLCRTIENLRPGGCDACIHKGKIKSPIVLGAEIEEAPEDEDIVHVDAGGATTFFKPPNLPEPYKRGRNGGIFVVEDEDYIPVYEHDLYLVKRMHDSNRGESVLARLHLPRENLKEFVIPLFSLSSKEELRKVLSFNGVIALPKQLERIMQYLVVCAKNQQLELDIEILRNQFGWADNNTKFILGSQEIGLTETRYSPPSETTEKIARDIYQKGELSEWKKVANTYNRPGFEPHAFGFLAAFGAPLIKFTNYNGGMINLLDSESGTGKTTVLKMINSVMGHPEGLLSKESDTLAHKKFRLGVYCNMAYTCDELTNMPPESTSSLIYEISQGEGSGRMQSQVNMERKNDTRWATIAVGTSNASLVQKLGLLKSTANGEIMRLMEYQVPRTTALTKNEAYQLYEGLMYCNFGLAGPVYIDWLVKNQEKGVATLIEVQNRIDAAANLDNRYRYWSAISACILSGGIIATELGLLDYDMPRIEQWATYELIPSLMRELRTAVESYTDVLGEFMAKHNSNTVILKNSTDSRTGVFEVPFLEPRNELLVRIEVDTKLIYIPAKVLRRFCTEEQIIYKDLLDMLRKANVFKGEVRKRMGKGTKINAPAVLCYEFSFADDDVFGAEGMIRDT